jgi:hypothetical protein
MMATKYWLQYHKYDERGEPEGFIINTTKSSCDKARGDLVFHMTTGFKNIGNTAYLPILLNLSGENE